MKSKAYIISLQMYVKACNEGVVKRVTFEEYTQSSYKKLDTGYKSRYIPENIVVIDATLLANPKLSARATKIICTQLMPSLCLNNALWYFDPTKSTADSQALKELKENGVIIRTEDHCIHFVNPEFIRKGTKTAVLACTAKELEGVSRVSMDNIRKLGYKEDEVQLKLMDISTLPGVQPTATTRGTRQSFDEVG